MFARQITAVLLILSLCAGNVSLAFGKDRILAGNCLAPVSLIDLKSSLAYMVSGIMTQDQYPLDYKLERVKFVLKNHPWFFGANIEKDFHANEYIIWFIDHNRNQVWNFSRKEMLKAAKQDDVVNKAMFEQDITAINEIISLIKDTLPLLYKNYPKKMMRELSAIKIYAEENILTDATRDEVRHILYSVQNLIKSVNWGTFSRSSDVIKTLFNVITGTFIRKLRDRKAFLTKQVKKLEPKRQVYYRSKVKSLKTISLISNLIAAEGKTHNFDDAYREQLNSMIADYNSKSVEQLNIYTGRITPEDKIINGNLYIRFDIDGVNMGVRIDRDGKVRYMPRRVFMEQEVKDIIKQLKGRYSSLFINHEDAILDNLFKFMQLSGYVVKKERKSVLKYLDSFKASKKDKLAAVDDWFYEFVKSRDHGFIHALMDLELVLKQVEYAVDPKNDYRLKGKKVVLKVEGQKYSKDQIPVKIENLIYATMLHDVTSILRRDEHHISGAFLARKILRDFQFKEEDINEIVNMIVRHRGPRHVPAVTFLENVLEKGDTVAAAEIDRLYYKESDMKQDFILDERITVPYRLLVNSGIFEHESFTENQNSDPFTFYMYSIMFRCFKETAGYTYEGFGPIEALLPDILDKEIKSLKRQIQFDARWGQALKTKYLHLVDMLFVAAKYLLQKHTIPMMEKHEGLFPLFKLPPYTDLKQEITKKTDILNYIIPNKRRRFLSLPKEERDALLYSIMDIINIADRIAANIEEHYEGSIRTRGVFTKVDFSRFESFGKNQRTLASAA